MIGLTRFERSLRRHLIRQVSSASPDDRQATCIGYGELGVEIDPDGLIRHPMTRPPFRGLNHALGHISMYEVEHGRPMLTALVINKDTGEPGPGFVELAKHLGRRVDDPATFWREELAAVVDFWTDDDPTRRVDAALERVIGELGSIKERLRRLS